MMHQNPDNHRDNNGDKAGRYSCFRCANGCIHIVADNLMFSLSREQFLCFADAICDFIRDLQREEEDLLLKQAFTQATVM